MTAYNSMTAEPSQKTVPRRSGRSGGTSADKKRRRAALYPRWVPYVTAAPALLLFVGVVGYPFVQSLVYGFQRRSLLNGVATFIGFDNISRLLSQQMFWNVVWQTIVFVGCSSGGAFLLALFLALALNTRMRGRGILRTAFLFPWILPGVVVSFLWSWIFDAHYGILNGLIDIVSGGASQGLNWLGTPGVAMMAIIVARAWNTFGWIMILILAALQGIPSETHDAAAVDGAYGLKKQLFVILPQIRPALVLALLLEIIHGFQQFDIPWVMTSGGPIGSTTTLSVDLYKAAFTNYDLGSAGAIGIAWTVIMAIIVVIFMIYTMHQEKGAKR